MEMPKVGSIILIRLVFLRMATSEPLLQRPTRKSRRLRGQEPQQATPEKVVGSVATPPFGGLSPCGDHTTSLHLKKMVSLRVEGGWCVLE